MNKTKGKSGTGRGTGKKGWNRWQASANRVKSAKPYISKNVKKSDGSKTTNNNKGDTSE
ncbi:DUF3934 family protein [Neobacillus cucumis]|uniref:DUF3934 family protein n=1 Tax=Neobacillus cucumis TaxID=1740721 RepID=UPI002852FB60|nr:DUF3934 family protein [Neobacillus cucumis]MDR4947492.1 DUF3934 family protein [Neobacillus cucumis]